MAKSFLKHWVTKREHKGQLSDKQKLASPIYCIQKENTPEMEFLDINLTRLESFAPCYSQSLLLADFKKPNSFLVLKILTKNMRNKETRVFS